MSGGRYIGLLPAAPEPTVTEQIAAWLAAGYGVESVRTQSGWAHKPVVKEVGR